MKQIFFLAAALTLVACGPTTTPTECGPMNCSGCCTASGACEAGTVAAACGGQGGLACDVCAAAQQCLAGVCTTPASCVPKTCAGLGLNCGDALDGCGGTLSCGTCGAGEACGAGGTANVCAPGTCTPKTCADQGFTCGSASDGCGSLLACGACPGGAFCGGGGPNKCGTCQPKTCTALAKNCGTVDDGCGGTVSCGTCAAPQTCGGGGTANVCGMGACVPKTCAELGKDCGTVNDGCNNMVSCGTCMGFQVCGAGGMANVCAAVCTVSCPSGFTCNGGVCSGGNLSSLVLNVPVPAQHVTAGTVTVNGAPIALDPVNPFCSGTTATLTFTHTTDTRFNASTTIACTTWAFSLPLYPGTYKVTVGPDTDSTTLPNWTTTVATAFVVSGPASNVVFDVPVPAQHVTSGTITVNGAAIALDPVNPFCSGTTATIAFEHTTDTRFNASTTVACTTWAFSLPLYPGTYKVSVGPDTDSTTLPNWTTTVATAFVVTAPSSTVVFDVPVPAQHVTSGTVTVNGAAIALDPVNPFCSGTTASISFTHATDSRFNATTTIACTTWAFSLPLYPGTYKVAVGPDTDSTTLPNWTTTVATAFVVTAPNSTVVFDVPVPAQHVTSGTITVNGAPVALDPVNPFCSGTTATIAFEHTTDTRFNATTTVACTTWAFSLPLYPGTYKVSVGPDTDSTTLPNWTTTVATAFVVTAPSSTVVFDVPVPAQHLTSGTITVNGAPIALDPVNPFCSGTTASISFTHATDARFNASTTVACTTWAFSLPLYPGTYKVTVGPDTDSTTLPNWTTTVATAFVVTAPSSTVVFNVPVPPQTTVSGTVQVNNIAVMLDPVNPFCSGTTATLTFTHLTDNRFNASTTVSCTTWAFTVALYPGTYAVTLGPDTDSTTLPSWSTLVVERLLVP